jgi:hypothetical protein
MNELLGPLQSFPGALDSLFRFPGLPTSVAHDLTRAATHCIGPVRQDAAEEHESRVDLFDHVAGLILICEALAKRK